MGLNISGIVIDKNYSDNLAEIEKLLGEKLHFQEELSFEETLVNWKEDDHCDVYFSEKGTLIMVAIERGGFDFHADGRNVFSFVLSEMTMMFCVNYSKNGKLIRSITETSDEGLLTDEGEPLPYEAEDDDKCGLIYHLIEEVLGESFDDIDLEAKCIRYSFEPVEALEEEEEDEDEDEDEVTEVPPVAAEPFVRAPVTPKPEPMKESKPWWKFW